jgi:hypothetical protein
VEASGRLSPASWQLRSDWFSRPQNALPSLVLPRGHRHPRVHVADVSLCYVTSENEDGLGI